MRDQLYHQAIDEPFRFDERVVEVFADMISRSVPGYESVIAMTGALAARFTEAEDRVYDLGASLGAGCFSIAAQVRHPLRIIAVDSSQAMIAKLEKRLEQERLEKARESSSHRFACIHEDINELAFEPAGFVALNYTLQFTPLEARAALLSKIAAALKPGGALILSEKIHFDDSAYDLLMRELHEDFKRRNGYSNTEIARKRRAIESVLITESLGEHLERLKSSGFKTVEPWFQCANFCSVLAIK